jgi:anti-sigma regulatory factor (Ser/Thr protein kinase)
MMGALKIEAVLANTGAVLDYVEAAIAKYNFPELLQSDIYFATEEIFVNIAHYAYEPGDKGFVELFLTVDENIVMRFQDSGKPFDPTKKEAPNLDIPIAEREIGGLGLHLVKKFMDAVDYEYSNGKNILTVTKKINKVG